MQIPPSSRLLLLVAVNWHQVSFSHCEGQFDHSSSSQHYDLGNKLRLCNSSSISSNEALSAGRVANSKEDESNFLLTRSQQPFEDRERLEKRGKLGFLIKGVKSLTRPIIKGIRKILPSGKGAKKVASVAEKGAAKAVVPKAVTTGVAEAGAVAQKTAMQKVASGAGTTMNQLGNVVMVGTGVATAAEMMKPKKPEAPAVPAVPAVPAPAPPASPPVPAPALAAPAARRSFEDHNEDASVTQHSQPDSNADIERRLLTNVGGGKGAIGSIVSHHGTPAAIMKRGERDYDDVHYDDVERRGMRGLGVMGAASVGVSLLMLGNMATTYGGKIVQHFRPNRRDDDSYPYGYQRRHLPAPLDSDSIILVRRQEKERNKNATTATIFKREDDNATPTKRGMMDIAGHTLTAGFFFQTAAELVPGMAHEAARVTRLAKNWASKQFMGGKSVVGDARIRNGFGGMGVPYPPLVAAAAARSLPDLSSSANEYPQLLRRRNLTIENEEEEEKDSPLLKRKFAIPPKWKPFLHKGAGIAGATVTLTMLAGVLDAPIQHVFNVIDPQKQNSLPVRRSLLEDEGKGKESASEWERRISSIVLQEAIEGIKLQQEGLQDHNTTTTDKLPLDNDSDEAEQIFPRAFKLSTNQIMQKALTFASHAVTATFLASLSDPLIQKFFNVVAPIRPKVQRRSLDSLDSPVFAKRDYPSFGDDAEVNFEKRFNLGKLIKTIKSNKVVNKIFNSKASKIVGKVITTLI